MLDNETKRRIDTARDILVGKLPDPKSQVEQITIALIYKFMDDMDAQSVEYGGEPSFFVGDYERFGWRKIFSPSIGGFEVLNLYGEAITSLNQNPNLPQLFRDVFKNAFLPYRDPETLKLFLKTINEFQYDHSERLGDAFEYLLSVLGSQGDAGQFRTPRHIIDFIVEVVQPKKNETVCDPACGTAGFLISSYKHILRANTRRTLGDLLTPDERKRLMTNFVGYDISPDMVRLSLVNMYLHGFPDPHIYEYDTLTSEERWNESFDVIMANPPFMSPKGGIKPHKKFSLQANRSEVLFADYIAEHINPVGGRAGMIVPEGIIFQSANAYRDLRKMLVEKAFLYAVVSLPAGVFQPYSGVKTSVLFFDKTLAAKTDKILFVKINNDGFGLGAQRKELKTSDLPDALNVILDFQKAILSGDTSRFADGELPLQALAVEKCRIAENGDFNLSVERYRTNQHRHSKYEMVELGDICSFEYGKALKEEDRIDGDYLVFGSNGVVGKHHEFLVEAPFIVIGRKGSAGSVHYSEVNGFPIDTTFYVKLQDQNKINQKFLFNILQALDLKNLNTQAGVPGLNRNDAYKLKIPLPPLSMQKEIVERVESYQRLIDGAKQVVKSFKPNIQINPDWQMVELGEVCEVINGRAYKQEELLDAGKYPVLRVGNFFSNRNWYYSDLELPEDKYCDKGDLLYAWSASFGPRIWDGTKAIYHYHIWKMIPDENRVNKLFLYHLLEKDTEEIKAEGGRGIAMVHITKAGMEKRTVSLPPLEEQKQIVAQIEREQSLVNANRELIEIYEQKIKDEINQLWES